MVVFEYDRGVFFAKTSACEWGGYLRRQLVVTGTKGTAELKPLEVPVEGGQYTCRTICRDTDWFVEGETDRSPVHDRYDGMTAAFAAMVRGGSGRAPIPPSTNGNCTKRYYRRKDVRQSKRYW